MRYLGLDLGSKTLGLSISDSLGLIATSFDVLRYENYEELLDKLSDVINTKKIEILVLGYPLNMNGTESVRCTESLKFKELLENKFNIKVVLQDERLSTVEAQNILISNNTRRNKRKKVIDKMASTIILQSYLDRSSNER